VQWAQGPVCFSDSVMQSLSGEGWRGSSGYGADGMNTESKLCKEAAQGFRAVGCEATKLCCWRTEGVQL
jgi:hypothetical protein